MNIQVSPDSNYIRPILYAAYVFLNGNEEFLRNTASRLFDIDASKLSEAEFREYHQILWLITAVIPFEFGHILPKVFRMLYQLFHSHSSLLPIIPTTLIHIPIYSSTP